MTKEAEQDGCCRAEEDEGGALALRPRGRHGTSSMSGSESFQSARTPQVSKLSAARHNVDARQRAGGKGTGNHLNLAGGARSLASSSLPYMMDNDRKMPFVASRH